MGYQLIVLFNFWLLLSAHKNQEDPLVVNTDSGPIRGFETTVFDEYKLHIYLGIPYAKPPLNKLRFKKPFKINKWQKVLNATQMPNSCMQEPYESFPGFRGEQLWNPNTNISEDCLYLNIWKPVQAKSKQNKTYLPIVIWIYGGGYISGTSTLAYYNASIMAAFGNVIVASLQYRLGAFGFLHLSPANKLYGSEAPGNMGLWDQRMAIKWIKRNSRTFGGDPDRITLFGESAGAGSVNAQLFSPVNHGSYKRGMLQSTTLHAFWTTMTSKQAYKISKALIKSLNCSVSQLKIQPKEVMKCLRNIEAKQISQMQGNLFLGYLGFPFVPTIDGQFLTSDPITMLKNACLKDYEIFIGNVKDEGSFFILYDYLNDFSFNSSTKLTYKRYKQIIRSVFKDKTPLEQNAIISQYLNSPETANYEHQHEISNAAGDYGFTCPAFEYAQNLDEHGASIYYYYFAHRSSKSLWAKWMGVLHGDEIEYFFGQPLNKELGFTFKERMLSFDMLYSFIHFAKTGYIFQ